MEKELHTELEYIKKMKFHSRRYQFETEVIYKYARLNADIGFVPIPVIYGNEKSNISHLRDILNFTYISIAEIFYKIKQLLFEKRQL